MDYLHRALRPPLGLFIESIWVYHNDPAPHTLERVLPTGAMQLIVNLKEDQTRLHEPERPDNEVPISYYGRTYEEGKKIGPTDVSKAVWYILYYNLVAPRLPAGTAYIRGVSAAWARRIPSRDNAHFGLT